MIVGLKQIKGRHHHAMGKLHKIYDSDITPFGHMSMGPREVSVGNINSYVGSQWKQFGAGSLASRVV